MECCIAWFRVLCVQLLGVVNMLHQYIYHGNEG
jgi:hypothetical protein